MRPLTAAEIAECFVNCTRGELRTMTPIRGLADVDWEVREFLGWRDPKAPNRAFLVTERDGRALGVELRATTGGGPRRGSALCDVCHTAHPSDSVGLFVARKTGPRGREGDTVGTYICSDLACPLYVRKLRPVTLPQGETAPPEVRAQRLQRRLDAFLDRVLAA
jgi:hypothetical protein